MTHMRSILPTLLFLLLSMCPLTAQDARNIPADFVPLFNGKNFSNWKVPQNDNGHWKIVDGVIDYDAESEAEDKNLWSQKEYGDFILYVDWRIKEVPWTN